MSVTRYTLSALLAASALVGCLSDCKPATPRAASASAPSAARAPTNVPPSATGDVAQAGADSMNGGSAAAAPPALAPPDVPEAEQRQVLAEAASSAWAYVKRNYSPASGLVKTHETYDYATMWDIASSLASYYSARELGLLSQADYEARTRKALATISQMALYDGSAYNKLYDARTGDMVDRQTRKTTHGYGWSAVDLGRLLTWLKIVSAHDAQFEPMAREIVSRLATNQIVRGGYLYGRDLDPSTGQQQDYVEGRMGYEQYAAAGFAAWGYRAERALDFTTNEKLVSVDGVQVPADKRGDDLLTSDPFVMMGMEMGWPTASWRENARRVFDAQYARYKKTGIVTMVGEDALPEPPAYFYYYVLYRNGAPFSVISATGAPAPEHVRWVSAKAAFGWYALLPSEYAWLAVQTVRPASSASRGWMAGVFENSKANTRSFNLNTSAVVLEAALYAQRRCPFIQMSCAAPAGAGSSAARR